MSQVAMVGENQEFLVYGLVAEEVRAALRAGRPADVETLVRDHPELAGQIRQLVPTLMLVQQMARDERDDPQSPHLPKTEVPQLLGDFRIIREIGRGGMGVVYEAEQVSLERRVALKVLPFAAVMDPRQLQRFQNEARAAASLHHTNIVPVHAVGSERGVHYYAMQYIDGVPLNVVIQELRQRRLDAADSQALLSDPDQQSRAHAAPPQAVESEPETARLRGALSTKLSATGREFFHAVARLAEQAALALDHAHERGIIHRDIKPANLLLDGAGILLITDFGLAQVQSDAKLTMTGDLLGTLRYMSPEQALAKRLIVDHRTDIYSLGATLYELLTLEPVFDGTDRQELLRQIAFDEPWPPRRLNKSIPPELEIIVGKALEKNPTDRYPTAQALADDLRRFLEDRPIQARRPSPMRRAQKWARRHKPLVGAAAVVLFMAAVLGGGSWMWWAQKRAAAEGEARAAMREAAGLLEEERWPEALSAARRAEGALLGVGADPALRRQARELIADLEMASQLQEAPLLGAPVKDGPFDADARDAAYAAAFRDYGLDVDGLDPQSAAEQVRARLIHRQLVGALDDWASARKLVKRDGWRQRLAVARAADPDAWRNRLRDALEGKDPKAVEEAATSGQVPDWPAQTFYLLGVLAHGTPAAEHAAALLQQAQQRYPNDFWINETLAVLLFESRSPYPEEAVRFSSIAVALRPQSPGARLNLGAALLDRGRLDEAIAECRVAVRLKKDYPEGHNGLGNALVNRGWLEEAISEFREAIRLKKDFPDAHNNLGNVLREKARLDEAIAECREAIRLQKDFPEAHCSLGGALREKGRLDEAIAEEREAIRLKKNCPQAHNNLGVALRDKGRTDEAIAECREAVAEYREAARLKKDYSAARPVAHLELAVAHFNLGGALRDKGRLDEAIAEWREAIRLNKDYHEAHYNLGHVLKDTGRLDEAIAAYREAILLKKDYDEAHNSLGVVLLEKGRLDEAIAEFREAIRLKKDYPEAHVNLGAVLWKKGRLDEAIAEYRDAIRLKKDNPEAHCNLGIALRDKGHLEEAIAEFREAIRLEKNCAEGHCNLGLALIAKGQFEEALASLRRGHELGSKRPGWPYPSAQWVKECERLVELDRKLPAFLRGEAKPAGAAEQAELAALCHAKRMYAAAARLFRDAFAAEPKLAADLNTGNRYNAACAASLAAAGQGEDAPKDEAGRAQLRRQALDWLSADLVGWARLAGKAESGTAVRKTLAHWRQDADLAGVRDPAAVAKLPAAERADWQKLWAEVDQRLKAPTISGPSEAPAARR